MHVWRVGRKTRRIKRHLTHLNVQGYSVRYSSLSNIGDFGSVIGHFGFRNIHPLNSRKTGNNVLFFASGLCGHRIYETRNED